jgi:microcin C transport system substrate-binding protein
LVILKEEAKKAGIELQLQLLDSSAFTKKVLEKNHQIASLGWSGGGLSPEYWQFYHSDNANKPQTNNITNFADPAMDALIDQYRAELSKPVRVELAHRMEQMLFDSGAMVPTFKVPYTREAYWAWIKLPAGNATRSSGAVIDAMGNGLFWIDVAEKNRIRALRRSGEPLSAPVTIVDETWK